MHTLLIMLAIFSSKTMSELEKVARVGVLSQGASELRAEHRSRTEQLGRLLTVCSAQIYPNDIAKVLL